jgi:hypothetical protein
MIRKAVAVVACTVTLFVWSGATQFFPWGVPSVRSFSSTTAAPDEFGSAKLEQTPPGTFTTSEFDARLGQGVSTLSTDESFSWIVSIARRDYNPTRYFVRELISQAMIASLLIIAFSLLSTVPKSRRLAIITLIASAAMMGSYGVMWNWWGLPFIYSAGMSFNLVAGWLLAFGLAQFILTPTRLGALRG